MNLILKKICKQYRFDEETANILKKKAEETKMTESAYVRYLIRVDYYRRLPVSAEQFNALYERLFKAGHILNIIARNFNGGEYDNNDFLKLSENISELSEIRMILTEMNKKIK